MNTDEKPAFSQTVFVVMQYNVNSDGWSSGSTFITVCKTLQGAKEKCAQLESVHAISEHAQKKFYFIETNLEE